MVEHTKDTIEILELYFTFLSAKVRHENILQATPSFLGGTIYSDIKSIVKFLKT